MLQTLVTQGPSFVDDGLRIARVSPQILPTGPSPELCTGVVWPHGECRGCENWEREMLERKVTVGQVVVL